MRRITPFLRASGAVTGLSMLLLVTTSAYTLWFWNAANGELLEKREGSQLITCLRASPNGETLAVGRMDGTVEIYTPSVGTL